MAALTGPVTLSYNVGAPVVNAMRRTTPVTEVPASCFDKTDFPTRRSVVAPVTALAMSSTDFKTSSCDGKLFQAIGISVVATLIFFVLAISRREVGLWLWLPFPFVVGGWVQYFYTKKHPRVWTIQITDESLLYLLAGKLVDEIPRSHVIDVRRDRGEHWWSRQEYPSVKLDLRNGQIHHVSGFRLAFSDQERFVKTLRKEWSLPGSNVA